jgi:hypothetical protein
VRQKSHDGEGKWGEKTKLKRLENADSNRLANRQTETSRFAPKPFRFSDKYNSNRLYIVFFWPPEFRHQKLPKIPVTGHKSCLNSHISGITLHRAALPDCWPHSRMAYSRFEGGCWLW